MTGLESAPEDPTPGGGELLPAIGALAVYALVGLAAFWHNLPFDNAHMLSTAVNDTTDVGWFLSWSTYAFTHLHNPMFSFYMEQPTGVNLASNQSMMLIGLLAAPITAIFGPFAALNATMWLGLVSSAFSAYLVARRLSVHRLPAFFAGLFFGYCPFVVAHSLENQNFTFLPLLPPILYLAYRIIAEHPAGTRRRGLWLGALCASQLYINPEPLAELVFVVAIVAVLSLVWRARRLSAADVGAIARGIGWALIPFVLLGAPFAYYFLLGPQHTSGPVVPLQYLSVFHTDLANLVAPNSNQLLAPTSILAHTDNYAGAINESGSYLGIPLLVGLVVIGATLRRARFVAFGLVTAALAALFSLGPELWINNHATGIALPDRLLDGVPMLQSAEPIRFFVVTDVAVALVLAVALDRFTTAIRAHLHRVRPGHAGLWSGASTALLAGVLLFPLIPHWPYPTYPIDIPSYFTTSDVDAIAPGAIVLTFPIPQSGAVNAMQWQIAAGFRFKIVSGYAYVANNDGVIFGNPPMEPGTFANLENLESLPNQAGQPPPVTVTTIAQTRQLLRNFHVDDFIMDPEGGYQTVEKYLDIALAMRPQSVGGVLVWYGVAASVRQSVPSILHQDKEEGLITSYPPPGRP